MQSARLRGLANLECRYSLSRIDLQSELKSAGAQIASIKDADLQSMNDYISAYAQIEPLQKEYDQKLTECGRAVPHGRGAGQP